MATIILNIIAPPHLSKSLQIIQINIHRHMVHHLPKIQIPTLRPGVILLKPLLSNHAIREDIKASLL